MKKLLKLTPEWPFHNIIGELVWSVSICHEVCISLEFGSPYLRVREPISASPDASADVKMLLEKRRVTVRGRWHLWIDEAYWEVNTSHYSMSRADIDVADIEKALNELDGQRLISVDPYSLSSRFVLRFDLGGSLIISISPESAGTQWSLYGVDGTILSCDRNAEIDVYLKPDKTEAPPAASSR